MKKRMFLLALMTFMLSFMVNAQEQQKSKPTPEQRVELRAKRISNALLLDEKTTSKFVPLYKEYVAALKAVMPKGGKHTGELTDAQRIERLQNRYAAEAEIAEVKKKYVAEFAKILTARQVEKVMKANEWQGKKKYGKKAGGNKERKMRGEKGGKK